MLKQRMFIWCIYYKHDNFPVFLEKQTLLHIYIKTPMFMCVNSNVWLLGHKHLQNLGLFKQNSYTIIRVRKYFWDIFTENWRCHDKGEKPFPELYFYVSSLTPLPPKLGWDILFLPFLTVCLSVTKSRLLCKFWTLWRIFL